MAGDALRKRKQAMKKRALRAALRISLVCSIERYRSVHRSDSGSRWHGCRGHDWEIHDDAFSNDLLCLDAATEHAWNGTALLQSLLRTLGQHRRERAPCAVYVPWGR